MKFNKKTVNAIINNYIEHMNTATADKDRIDWEIGYYQPTNTNWCYHIGFNKNGLLMVERFGMPVMFNI